MRQDTALLMERIRSIELKIILNIAFCGAGRFGFDFDNSTSRDEKAFDKAIEALKNAKAIRFSSMITNEEAHILELLKSKLGVKLFNEDARVFAEFMRSYSSISGKNFTTVVHLML